MPTIEVQSDPAQFDPLPDGQTAFLDDHEHRYCAYVGGWGAGKSWAGSRKTANLHLYNACDEDGKPTYVHSLIVAPTYQLAQTINIPQMREAFDAMGLSHRFIADPKVYAFVLPDLGTARNPSYVFVRSADAADKIAGFEVGAVWGDEAARWPFCREDEDPLADPLLQSDGRLRHPRARFKQFNLTYTPEGEDTRVFRDFEENPKPGHALYRSSTRQNTHLPRDYVESQLEQLSPDLAGQYVDGYAARLGANLIYSNFDLKRNTQPAPELVYGLPLQMGIDFNKVPGMHACIGQHHTDKDLLTTCRVVHRKGMLILQMVQEFDQLYGEDLRATRYPHVELFGDTSGNTGSMKDGETYWDVIREELKVRKIPFRMRLPSSNPGIADRANCANSAFCSASGKVRWVIRPDCEPLIRDFRAMKWDGNKMDKTDKDRSHASDGDTYRVAYLLPIRKIERRSNTQVYLTPTH